MVEIIWTFSPWYLFLIVARFGSIDDAVAAGAAAAVIVLARGIVRRRIYLFNYVGVLLFFIFGAILLFAHPGHLDNWSRYAQAIAHGTLTVVTFGSLLAGHPFTEQYSRGAVPQAYLKSREFLNINRQLTGVLGVAFLVGTVSLIIAGSHGSSGQFVFRLVIPFGSMILAMRYVKKKSDDFDSIGARDGEPTPTS